jgi:hypothetical protein
LFLKDMIELRSSQATWEEKLLPQLSLKSGNSIRFILMEMQFKSTLSRYRLEIM